MTERRELTFDDVLQFAGVHEAQSRLERLMPDPATLPDAPSTSGCDSASCGCGKSDASNPLFDKPLDRRGAIGTLVGALAVVTQAATACSPLTVESDEGGVDVNIKTTEALPEVLYGYAFNISKCKGFRNCVQACIEENNLDRRTDTQYIRIFEMEEGSSINDLDHGSATYGHAVPAEGHFYMGTQCFQCANPPCVYVCPVQATWQEPDGIVVVDYNWCVGCRYCLAACPYWARRFNWGQSEVPPERINPNQHYLGNRERKKGSVEKCTFCIQRSREGRLPACVEACPTGARIFGNILDPDSEVRWILKNKELFRLKEELGTEPRFWYFID